jgi:hypothetical protein
MIPAKGVEKNNQDNQTTGQGFQQILNDTVEKKTAGQDTQPIMQPPVSTLQEIFAPSFDLESDPLTTIQGMTDELLEMLELYTNGLGNDKNTLRNLAPMLDRIKGNADALVEKIGNMEDADPDLKEIATQSAMLANTEYLKFQRGDYI